MAADGTRWIVEGEIDPRWPINTRGNVGEVFPEVLTPLSYELAIPTAERAWRSTYFRLGIGTPDDFSSDDPVIIGLYGGYCYLNLSYLRMMGVRAPGSSADAIDVSFFGEGDPPPYVPQPGDKNLKSSFRILKTVLGALGQRELPDVVSSSFQVAAAFESQRPPLDESDDALVDYLFAMRDPFFITFGNHMETTALAAIVTGVLADACAAAGEPGLVTHLVGAAGDVRSARYSLELWELAKLVRDEPRLAAVFDDGVDGILDRLRSESEAQAFLDRFDDFVTRHGHRGPNDWELSGRTWDNTPELALVAVDRMRLSTTDLDPADRLADNEKRREAAIAKVRPAVGRLDRLNFDRAIKSAPYWAQAREATRDRAVRSTLPVKQVYRELVRRAAERGGSPDPSVVALLQPSTELRPYLADPASFAETLTERVALRDRFAAVEPRFFITSQGEVPTIEELEAEQAASPSTAATGEVLAGNAGSQGVAKGKVRVVLDPADAGSLAPGEILVAPLTDPAWTPLFLPAAAVVVNVGALMSHAVIVSRELGIPCVVAVDGATERLETGMTVEVDGTAGTVTVC
ncbi:MAG: PEP-utilizing enzyme [Acidimicrobiales bacterium]